MKVFIDANVFDWFLDAARGGSLLSKFRNGELEGLVFPEVSKEIHDIPSSKSERRHALVSILRSFFPVQPTRVPISGLARAGAALIAPTGAKALREELIKLGLRKLDIIHLMNAHYARCDVFLTNDREDILRRTTILEGRLGVEILEPATLLDRLELDE